MNTNMEKQFSNSKVWVRGHYRKDPRTNKVVYVHGHWRNVSSRRGKNKAFSYSDDPKFRRAVERYIIESKIPIDGGTSPAFLVKLKGDGYAVQKNLINRPEDFQKRPGESQENFELRKKVASLHRGILDPLASLIVKELGMDIMPDTVLTVDNNGRFVTLSKFIENAKVFAEFEGSVPPQPERMAMIKLLNLIMGNSDMNETNVLIDPDGLLWIIDFGHARPETVTEFRTYDQEENLLYYDDQKLAGTPFAMNEFWEVLPTHVIHKIISMDRYSFLKSAQNITGRKYELLADFLWQNIQAVQDTLKKKKLI